MKSKKSLFFSAFIALVAYNAVMFLIPVEKNINFWIAYVSTIIAILYVIGVFYSQLTNESVKNNVKKMPLAWVAWEYFILQVIFGFVEVLYPMYYKTSLIINIVLFCLNNIILSIVSTQSIEIQRVEQKVNEKVLFTKSLKEEVDAFIDKTDNMQLKDKLQGISDAIRYSDPITHSKLAEIEGKVEEKVCLLKKDIELNKTNEIEDDIASIKILLEERNRKALLYKGVPEEHEIEKKSNNRGIIISSVTIVALLVIGITSYYFAIVPYIQYNKAEKLLQDKNYIEAREAYEKMDNYKDSKDKAKEAMYRYATDLFQNGNYEKSEKVFEELADYKDSKLKKNETIYKHAQTLLKNGKYIEASDEFKRIPTYLDSNNMVYESIYNYAIELYQNKKYSESAEQFLKLGNYKDSKSKVLEIYNYFGDKDVIYFGKYNNKPIGWQVLDSKEKKVLLIATDTLDEMYVNSEYKAINWDNSLIRKWLNNEFYNSFDENEKANLLINASGKDTMFILTASEVEYYKQIKNCGKSWWINSKGKENTMFMYVDENGNINKEGDIVTKLHGVRPAIWLNLE